MRVLVAEDFRTRAAAIGTGLRREGMAVDVVLDGDDALEHLAVTRYDVIVLDRDLPGTHGDDVCRRIVADRPARRGVLLTGSRSARPPPLPCPTRWTSPSCPRASAPSAAAPPRRCPRCCRAVT